MQTRSRIFKTLPIVDKNAF